MPNERPNRLFAAGMGERVVIRNTLSLWRGRRSPMLDERKGSNPGWREPIVSLSKKFRREAAHGIARLRFTGIALRTGIGVASSCGYFFVEGQINRHGCERKVAVKSFVLLIVCCNSGPS